MMKIMKVRQQMLAIAFLILMVGISPATLAYQLVGECAKSSQERYDQAEITVLAELESIGEEDIGTLKVLKTYKGNIKVGERITYKVLPRPNLVVGGEQTFVAQPYDDIGDIVQIFAKATPDANGVLQLSGCWRTGQTVCKRELEACLKRNSFKTQEK